MQDLIDDISPQLTALLSKKHLTEKQFYDEYGEILSGGFAWLTETRDVRPTRAICMTMTVFYLVLMRLKPPAASSAGTAVNSLQEDIFNDVKASYPSVKDWPAKQLIASLVEKYGDMQESCGTLFESKNSFMPEREPWMEEAGIQALFEQTWHFYTKSARDLKVGAITPEEFAAFCPSALVQHAYRWIVERYELPMLPALSTAHAIAFFVIEQRNPTNSQTQQSEAPVKRQAFEYIEASEATALTTAAIADLEQQHQTERARRKSYKLICHLLVDYRRQLHRPRRRKR